MSTEQPSINFEMLRQDYPLLADLGGFSEVYAYTDPSSALVKLRSLGEQLTKAVYQQLRLSQPQETTFVSHLMSDQFEQAVPEIIRNMLHGIRKSGNRAAHGGTPTTRQALSVLEDAFGVSAWFSVRCLSSIPEDIGGFLVPPKPSGSLQQLEALKQELEDKLEQALEELEKLKTSYQAQQVTPEMAAQGQKAADTLAFNEEATRKRIIDVTLAEAGWDVEKADEVSVEEEVTAQATATGTGYADYVLWDDDGKPLAVIEAKRTAKSEQLGQKQASGYADALEKKYGRRPIIFYTNGYNIWLWDDTQGYPPRRLFGFYSKASLQRLVSFQRSNKQPLIGFPISSIASYPHQMEAIKSVAETFEAKRRSALIVQATGTGKTRVAISISELLIRAKWAKRILFLCDRKELVKQAKNAFIDHTNEPVTVVSRRTVDDSKSRIFIATYPSMMQIFQAFDVGFFDLIIADESHRSIYNRYRDLFRYFDCLQIGLTATPVEFISRNTYGLFGCNNQDPTSFYSLEQAVLDKKLVPYEVYTHTTKFLREGIKYSDLSPEQIEQLEEEGEDPTLLNHEAQELDRKVFNKDTNRHIIRNLMENGIKDIDGQLPGKSIIFARNHHHAVILQQLFDEMYPQYGGKFCQVIDTYDQRAEQLIDDFKGLGNNKDLTIAISVDMLDTGLDVPEIVNLVFAKPVKSKVKFWQMIGRGTRLCEDLYGPGKHKTVFRIFDHWGNFEYFEQNKPEAEPSPSTSLMQQLFNTRLELASTALKAAEPEIFDTTIRLIAQDIQSLPLESISVKEKWGTVEAIKADGILEAFSPATLTCLQAEISPLTQWINIRGHMDAYGFDLLVTQLQIALLRGTNAFEDLKGDLLNAVNRLRMNLNPVKAKAEAIKKIRSAEFWDNVSCDKLEAVRKDLRAIMQYKEAGSDSPVSRRVVDVSEEIDGVRTEQRKTGITSIDLAAYRKRVEEALEKLFDTNPTLQKIREGEPVSEDDLQALVSLVLTENPDVDLDLLREFYPDLADHLDAALRTIIGMDEDAVKDRFQEFMLSHPALTAKQTQFLRLLQRLIAQTGGIKPEQLFDAPFTRFHEEGFHGVFPDAEQQNELLRIIGSFNIEGFRTTNEANP
jgi:type I restriction enzyme R subunit